MLLYQNELKRKHIVRYDICRCRHKRFIKNQNTLFQPESGRKEKASITFSFPKKSFFNLTETRFTLCSGLGETNTYA